MHPDCIFVGNGVKIRCGYFDRLFSLREQSVPRLLGGAGEGGGGGGGGGVREGRGNLHCDEERNRVTGYHPLSPFFGLCTLYLNSSASACVFVSACVRT